MGVLLAWSTTRRLSSLKKCAPSKRLTSLLKVWVTLQLWYSFFMGHLNIILVYLNSKGFDHSAVKLATLFFFDFINEKCIFFFKPRPLKHVTYHCLRPTCFTMNARLLFFSPLKHEKLGIVADRKNAFFPL